jgi:PBSX family phage terminase large subunit
MTTINFKKTLKQVEAIRLMSQFIEVLLEGGSRSGKTFIAIYAIFVRSLKYPGSMHLIVRFHAVDIIASLWSQTIPKVLKICFPGLTVETNEKKLCITLPNKSQIWLSGTDDKERIEKLLGQEWDTIYMNEGSQFPYSTYEVLKTRLNPQQGIKPLFIIDYNPPSMSHWGYKLFRLKQNPETRQPLQNTDRYNFLQMNPDDNKENLSEGYIDTLNSLSDSKKRRFLHGEYGDDAAGALWKREWIDSTRKNEIEQRYNRIIVAVDPAVTAKVTSDDTGIITAGEYKYNGSTHWDVLEDNTYHGDVTGWGAEVIAAYNRHKADRIIGETNNGGDLVQMNIRNYGKNAAFDSVHASRGKAIRAEPIADLYRTGRVHHIGYMPDLEDELCSWNPQGGNPSPNRLDALVWCISYMSENLRGGGPIKMSTATGSY